MAKSKRNTSGTKVPAEKGTTLREIIQQGNVILDAIMAAGGELSPELETALDNVDLAQMDKVDSYVWIMDRMKHEAKYWKEKKDFAAAVQKSITLAETRVKDRIKAVMTEGGIDEVKGSDMRFRLQNGQDKLEIDEAALPDEYKMQEVKWVPDKERIKADLEMVGEIPGVRLVATKVLRTYANKNTT